MPSPPAGFAPGFTQPKSEKENDLNAIYLLEICGHTKDVLDWLQEGIAPQAALRDSKLLSLCNLRLQSGVHYKDDCWASLPPFPQVFLQYGPIQEIKLIQCVSKSFESPWRCLLRMERFTSRVHVFPIIDTLERYQLLWQFKQPISHEILSSKSWLMSTHTCAWVEIFRISCPCSWHLHSPAGFGRMKTHTLCSMEYACQLLPRVLWPWSQSRSRNWRHHTVTASWRASFRQCYLGGVHTFPWCMKIPSNPYDSWIILRFISLWQVIL